MNFGIKGNRLFNKKQCHKEKKIPQTLNSVFALSLKRGSRKTFFKAVNLLPVMVKEIRADGGQAITYACYHGVLVNTEA